MPKEQVPWNKKEHIVKVCKCGIVFTVRPSLDRVKSCSLRCAKLGNIPWNKGTKGLMTPNSGYFKKGMTGNKSPAWKGGITSSNKTQRIEFRNTMQSVIFARDNYICQICDQYSGNLQVDHIKPWKDYPELRFAESNCRTLCMACHYYITYKRKLPQGVIWGHNLSRRVSS